MSSKPDLQMVEHMFNYVLSPPSYTGSRPLRGSGSPYTPTANQTKVTIFVCAEGRHCKSLDPTEKREPIAVHPQPNVMATVKLHPKVHKKLSSINIFAINSKALWEKTNEDMAFTCHMVSATVTL